MAKNVVHVPRDEIVRLLGLSPEVSDETLRHELDSALAQIEAGKEGRRVSAAEQSARAEDRRIVLAAYNAGKIGNKNRIEFWCDALQRDREGNRALLGSLAAGLPPVEKLPVDAELEDAYAKVLARLGIKPPPAQAAPRSVAAASYQAPPPTSPRVDDLGLPIPRLPPPVRLSEGTPPEQWTERQLQDAHLRRLGPRFYPGTEPPPAQDVWYQPGLNDPYRHVEGCGWEPNPDYRPRV